MFFPKRFVNPWFFGAAMILLLAFWLRFTQLTQVPSSPYWEEVALGYDAYSLLKTGKDHHGNPWPIVAFESFGDWKPSGYFYLLLPSLQLFGLTVWAVRLPTVIAGWLLVVAVGVVAALWVNLVRVDHKTEKNSVPLWFIALFLTAVSPWAITFSRVAWEVMVATSLLTWGMACFLAGLWELRQKGRVTLKIILVTFLAVFLLIASTYVYHSLRVIAPLMGLVLFGLWWWEIWCLKKPKPKSISWSVVIWVFLGLFGLLSLWPQLKLLRSPAISRRLAETSIFSLEAPILQSNELRLREDTNPLSRVFYHRHLLYGRLAVQQFFAHFDLDYLFLSGDSNQRHSVQFFGLFYPFDLPLLLIGLYVTSRKWGPYTWLLLVWLVFGILPAAISQAAPHALRTLPVLPVSILVASLGLQQLIFWLSSWVKKIKKLPTSSTQKTWLLIMLVAVVYGLQVSVFWRFYSRVYPALYAREWQFGYQEMISAVHQLEGQHPEYRVYITREQGRPAMYYWFFNQIDPRRVQAADPIAKQVEGEYIEFENLTFPKTHSEITSAPAIFAGSELETQALEQRVAAGVDKDPRQVERQKTVIDPTGKTVWVVSFLLPKKTAP